MVAGASPALVSSLLIRSDQLRRSMFGFRSASSTLAAQWSILRFVVQLSYRPSFATLRFAARSPSSQRAGLDTGCGTTEFHFRPATYSRSSVSFHAAADLMAPVLSTGMLVVFSTLAIKPCGD